MLRTLIHCFGGNESRQKVIENAATYGLTTEIKYPKIPYAVDILGTDSQTIEYNTFIQQYLNEEYAIFYDLNDSRSLRNKWKSRGILCPPLFTHKSIKPH